MRRRIRRALAWTLGIVAALTALLGAVLGALLLVVRTPAGNAWLRRTVLGPINARIAGELAVARVELDPRRLVFHRVTLASPSGAIVARVRRIVVEVDLLALLRHEVHVPRIELLEPQAQLLRENGALDVQRALAPPPGAAPLRPERVRPEWALRLDDVTVRAGSLTYEPAAQSSEDGPRVVLNDLTASGSGSWWSADRKFSANVELSARAAGIVDGAVRVTARLRRSDRGRLTGAAALSLGDLLDGRVDVSEPGPTIDIHIRHAKVPAAAAASLMPAYPLASDVSLEGTATLAPHRAAVNLNGAAGGGEVHVQGTIDPDACSTPTGVHASVRGADLGTLLRGVRGRAPLSIELHVLAGSLRPRKLSGSFAVRAAVSEVRGERVGPLELRLQVRGGDIEAARLSAHGPGVRLRAQASGRLDDARVHLVLAVANLRRATRALARADDTHGRSVAGHGRVVVSASGSLLDIAGTAAVRLSARFPRLTVGGTTIEAARLAASAGVPRPDGARPFSMSARADWAPMRGATFVGAEGELELERREAVLTHVSIALPGARWTSSSPARVTFGRDGTSLEELSLRSGEQAVAADASLEGARLAAHLRLHALRLSALPGLRSLPVGGRASGELEISGSTRAPTVTAALELDRVRVGGARGISASVSGRYTDGRVDAGVHAENGWAAIDARLDVPASWLPRGVAPVHVTATIARLDLAGLSAALDLRRRLTGDVAGKLQLSGFVGAPNLEASLSARRLAIGASRFRPEETSAVGTLEASARYSKRRLRFTADADDLHGGSARLEGTLHVDLSPVGMLHLDPARAAIDARASADGLRTAWLAGLSDRLRTVRGRLDATARLAGTLGTPRLTGRLSWRRGSLVVVPPAGR